MAAIGYQRCWIDRKRPAMTDTPTRDGAAELRLSLKRLRDFIDEAGNWPDAQLLAKRLEQQIMLWDMGVWEHELRGGRR